MKDYAPGIKSTDLTLADMPTPTRPAPAGLTVAEQGQPVPAAADAAVAEKLPPAVTAPPAPVTAPAVENAPSTGEDEFLAQAEREYAAGRVDKPLWARAVTLAGGDEARAVTGYLRARAIALRVSKKARPGERSLRRPETANGANGEGVEVGAATAPKDDAPQIRGIGVLSRKHMIWAAGAVAILVISSGLFIFQSGGDTTQQASAATPVARANPA